MQNSSIKKHYSIGYVYCHRNDVNYHELMHIADERMYEEKNERKAREERRKNDGKYSRVV